MRGHKAFITHDEGSENTKMRPDSIEFNHFPSLLFVLSNFFSLLKTNSCVVTFSINSE